MKTIGIIAEYNPFHKGHEAQLRLLRERFGPDCRLVVALGGCFTQRGEAALFTKYARAEAAVRCGADLILELPLPWAASSAEAPAPSMPASSAIASDSVSMPEPRSGAMSRPARRTPTSSSSRATSRTACRARSPGTPSP